MAPGQGKWSRADPFRAEGRIWARYPRRVALLTDRFDRALAYASEAHRNQVRKGTSTPYLAHLLAVAALVLEHGGDEDQAIAGLLHDTAEDAGGEERLADIRDRFGDRVAAIVDACTDTYQSPKPPWRHRKEAFLARLPTVPGDALLVMAADKVHNAGSILADLDEHGDAVWGRFSAPPPDQVWYYRSLAGVLGRLLPGPLTDRLSAAAENLAGRIDG